MQFSGSEGDPALLSGIAKMAVETRASAFQTAQRRFDAAADVIGLSDDARQGLREVKRELTVHFPVRMDDGSVHVFTGWRVQQVRVRAELEHGASWMIEAVLKDPTAERSRIAAPLKTRLEQAPPAKAVERLAVEFTGFAPGTAELQLFARDASAAARAGRRRALERAVREIALRLRRAMLYHVIEVQPWSRIPERRYALIDFEP